LQKKQGSQGPPGRVPLLLVLWIHKIAHTPSRFASYSFARRYRTWHKSALDVFAPARRIVS